MIFLDTNFIVGYKIENDDHHNKVQKIIKEISEGKYGRPVISDYIFDETVTVVFSKSKKLPLARETGIELRAAMHMIDIDSTSFDEAWNVFKNQKNKFSFTDCTSLVLMKKHGIKNIATFDKEFKKEEGIEVVDA